MKLSDYLYYDVSSPTFLRWKVSKGKVMANAVAGYLGLRKEEKDYGYIKLQGRRIPIARVIWELFNGPIPNGMVIDHLDGDKWNNRISNLAVKTRQGNTQNLERRSDNKSGIPGICIRQQRKGKYVYNYIFAYIGNGTNRTKVFSIDKLGYDEALKLAIRWRLQQVEILNSQGHQYTSRHIKACHKITKEKYE